MQDRISNHPNRWKIKDVNTGVETLVDLTRADDPTQTGTPLNKATFLPDAVASAIETATGASDVELPANALYAIATFLSGIGATNSIARCSVGTYTGTGTRGASNPTSLTFPFVPRFLIVYKNTDTFGMSAGNGFIWTSTSTAFTNGAISLNDKTVSWYSTTNAEYQRNTSGQEYAYFAVGVDS